MAPGVLLVGGFRRKSKPGKGGSEAFLPGGAERGRPRSLKRPRDKRTWSFSHKRVRR